jgi:dihydrofolate reductase
MRKLLLHIMVSLDGLIEDRDRGLDWHFSDDECERYINEVLGSIDGMIFGRVAHQLLAEYWPTAGGDPEASEAHVEAARMMNALPKYAVTASPYETDWQSSHVLSGDIAARVRALKDDPGRDRLVVNPVLLGDGTPLFKRPSDRARLKLAWTRPFESGAIVLCYRPV